MKRNPLGAKLLATSDIAISGNTHLHHNQCMYDVQYGVHTNGTIKYIREVGDLGKFSRFDTCETEYSTDDGDI